MFQQIRVVGSIAICLLLAAAVPAQESGVTAPGPARVVRQWVQPEVYRGSCPVILHFFAEIEKGGWGTVTYRWVRSDGHRTVAETVDFADWRPRQITMTWRVDGRSGETVWASIEILEPAGTEVRVGKAVARILCPNRSSAESDPCDASDSIGPISSRVRLCLLQRYDEAGVGLTEALSRLRSTLRPSADDAKTTIGQAEANRHRALLESQQHWENFRDSACQEVYFEYWPGSMADEARLECLIQLTQLRTTYLKERIGDERPGED